jgi:hypothetical protein
MSSPTPSLPDIPQLLRNDFTQKIIHELYQQDEEVIVFVILQLATLVLQQDSSVISSPSSQISVYLKEPKHSYSRTSGAKSRSFGNPSSPPPSRPASRTS